MQAQAENIKRTENYCYCDPEFLNFDFFCSARIIGVKMFAEFVLSGLILKGDSTIKKIDFPNFQISKKKIGTPLKLE